jgi:hypothetical protein
MARDAAGNVFLGGAFHDAMILGDDWAAAAAGTDAVVIKLSAAGEYLWSKHVAGGGSEWVYGVAVGGDGDVTIGGEYSGTADFGDGIEHTATTSDGFIARYAGDDGALRWVTTFPSESSSPVKAVAVDEAGDVYATGWSGLTTDFDGEEHTGTGDRDLFVGRFRGSDGGRVWVGTIGGFYPAEGRALAFTSTGDLLLGGNFAGDVDLGCGVLSGAGSTLDVLVARLTPDGDCTWSRRYGGNFHDELWALARSDGDDVAIAGSFVGTADFGGGAVTPLGELDVFVTSLSSDGAVQWARRVGGAGTDEVRALAFDDAGDVVVAGQHTGAIFAGAVPMCADYHRADLVVLRGATGVTAHQRQYGVDGAFSTVAALARASDRMLVVGAFTDSIDLGDGAFTVFSSGQWNSYVAELDL